MAASIALHERHDARAADDKPTGLISHWLFPLPVSQPRLQVQRYYRRSTYLSPATALLEAASSGYRWQVPVAGCIPAGASGIASLLLTRYFTMALWDALQNITEVVHDVRTNRNFHAGT